MTTARQWVATGFGGPEVLHLREIDVPPAAAGEVSIAIRASGMNPADYKHFSPGQDSRLLPLTIGYEAAGVITAIGPGTQIATGGGRAGDERAWAERRSATAPAWPAGCGRPPRTGSPRCWTRPATSPCRWPARSRSRTRAAR
jgi:NADPH:quinone reductase-like Zn-dependent oxidoreductase